MNNEIRYLKNIYSLFLLGLILIISISWYWNYKRVKENVIEFAKIEASASFNKDLLYRRWASMHGGVYVPISETTPPNPSLIYIKNRDIKADNGITYTLVNPAYMTRQVHEIAKIQYGVKGHITSLNPIRTLNKPDPWEAKALHLFEKGEKEFSSIETIDSSEYLRYMRAMVTEESCLKCHAHQGYKIGDIRGGISVSVPMEKYNDICKAEVNISSVSHLIIFLISFSLSLWAYRRLLKEMHIRNEIQQKLKQSEATLQKQNNEYALLNEEYKKQNTELITAKNLAEESDKLKTAFIQNISHEIRTPMNSIIGFSELIEDPALPIEKRHRFVDIIINSTRQLLAIVNNILTISALDKKQETVENDRIFLNSLLDDLLIVFNQKAVKNNTVLKKTEGLPLEDSEIITDQTKLTQILTNLISNALKFAPQGIIEFGYTVKDNELEFFVKDNGIGIKKEHQTLIFERFRQADINIGKKYGGNGLGLSISKGFVEMMGGKMWVESAFGKGATFKFTLPYKKDIQ